jgi:hypothetical protein
MPCPDRTARRANAQRNRIMGNHRDLFNRMNLANSEWVALRNMSVEELLCAIFAMKETDAKRAQTCKDRCEEESVEEKMDDVLNRFEMMEIDG